MLETKSIELLTQLATTPGVPGREHRIREVIASHMRPVVDEITTDNLGSLICRRAPRGDGAKGAAKSGSPLKVMIAAHMDQIGFLVRHIDDKGFLRLQNVGGFDTRNLFARVVTVCTSTGDIEGVLNPGGKPVHIASDEDRKKIPEINDLIVDLGMSGDDVKTKVKIGDMVVLQAPVKRIGDSIVSQCLDNRIACWASIEVARLLGDHACEIYFVFTVQEEVGCRGAGLAADAIKPDIAIALDTTLCCDTPSVPDELRMTVHGDGVGLMVFDASAIVDLALLEEFEAIAKAKNIPAQRTMLPRGGTDASTIQKKGSGYRVMTIVCPTRYIHTVTEMVHVDDVAAYRDLVEAYLSQAGS